MELKDILEALLFNSQKPLTAHELRDILKAAAEQSEEPGPGAFKRTPVENIETALEQLRRELEAAGRSFRLASVAGTWQFASQPDFAPWLRVLLGQKSRPPRLSAPSLETLAIIAYRQPVTRAEIEMVRGVAVDGVMQTLLERGLVEQVGRAEVVGRPSLYGTTSAFLEYFGLRGLADLPAADELRRIPVHKPEALLTVDPGLATAPPAELKLGDAPLGTSSSQPPAPAREHEEQEPAPARVSSADVEPPEQTAPEPSLEAPAPPPSALSAMEPSPSTEPAPAPRRWPRKRAERQEEPPASAPGETPVVENQPHGEPGASESL